MTVCCHVTVCLCSNGGIGGRHLAIVTRCKTAKAIVKPFITVAMVIYLMAVNTKAGNRLTNFQRGLLPIGNHVRGTTFNGFKLVDVTHWSYLGIAETDRTGPPEM